MSRELNMEALRVAKLLMEKRGYVVIAFPLPLAKPIPVGAFSLKFAGRTLPRHFLRVTGDSTQAEWLEQARVAYGEEHVAKVDQRPGRFYRCLLLSRKELQSGGAI